MAGLIFVSILVMYSKLCCTKDSRTLGESSAGTSLTALCLVSWVGVAFSNGALLSVESNLQFWQQLGLLWAPMGPLWPTTQLNITQSKYLKIQCFLNKESRKGQS